MRDFDIPWIEPWKQVIDGETLVAELHRELCATHPLHGRTAVPLGQRINCDDVLFHLPEGPHPFAIVHLTWTVETDPEFPWTTFFANANELKERLRRHTQEWATRTRSSN